jgi:hypothetical protein
MRSEELTKYSDPVAKSMVSMKESRPEIPTGQISWRAFSWCLSSLFVPDCIVCTIYNILMNI